MADEVGDVGLIKVSPIPLGSECSWAIRLGSKERSPGDLPIDSFSGSISIVCLVT